jgi:hypothetical protein
MNPPPAQRLQEVSGGCFVLEEGPEGFERIDFFDSIELAREEYPRATMTPREPITLED